MRSLLSTCLALTLIAGCSPTTAPGPTAAPSSTTTTTPKTTTSSSTTASTATSTTSTTTTVPPTTLPEGVTEAPDWLGTRELEVTETGVAEPAETPPELVDRRFVTEDLLEPPGDDGYHATIEPVPEEVATRSTWSDDCPVAIEDLAYVTLTFHGFDGQPHTGELVVAAEAAEDMVAAFRDLFEAEFPIEEMRVASVADLEAAPTGDGNVTTAFVCRPATGGTSWSEHAYGLAIDINPFHNPYYKDGPDVRGGVVLPELAGAYLDRDRQDPGMIHEGDTVTQAFDRIGWEWGGRWNSLKDYQHFSLRGR